MKNDDFHFDPNDDGFWKDELFRSSLEDWDASGGLEDIDWSRETENYPPRRASRAQQGQPGRPAPRPRQDSRYDRARPSPSGSRPRPSNQQPNRPRPSNQQASRTRSYDQRGQSRPPAGRSSRSYEEQARARNYENRRRRQRRNVPLILVAVVLAIGMVVAGWQLISILLNYQRDRSAYNDLAANAISSLAETDGGTGTNVDTDTDAGDSGSFVPIIVDWEYLESINTDIVGWIYSPDTIINYPVVQTSDNEYYLYRGFNKEGNTTGTLFADINSVMGINMCNFIIYGHHMKDNSMFGTLENYVNQSYYDEHPIMYYLTPTSTYRIDLIAGHIVESTMDNYPGYFESVADYQTYLNQITSASLFSTSATVSTDYQLITLSTCDYSSGYEDPRFLLHGLLVPFD